MWTVRKWQQWLWRYTAPYFYHSFTYFCMHKYTWICDRCSCPQLAKFCNFLQLNNLFQKKWEDMRVYWPLSNLCAFLQPNCSRKKINHGGLLVHSILCHPLHYVAFSTHLYFGYGNNHSIIFFCGLQHYQDVSRSSYSFCLCWAINISWYCRLTFVTVDTFHR